MPSWPSSCIDCLTGVNHCQPRVVFPSCVAGPEIGRGRIGVPKIMHPQLGKPGGTADAPPGALHVDPMRALALARKDEQVPGHPGDAGEDLGRGSARERSPRPPAAAHPRLGWRGRWSRTPAGRRRWRAGNRSSQKAASPSVAGRTRRWARVAASASQSSESGSRRSSGLTAALAAPVMRKGSRTRTGPKRARRAAVTA